MTCVDPMEIVYTGKSRSNHPYTSKEGYETFEQQWMSLLVAHPHISHVDWVLEI